MSDSPDPDSSEQTDLVDRLRALGETSIDPAVASAHLTAMAAVPPTGPRLRPRRERLVRAKVAAAFAAGLVLGGTGLASAGALGATPQNAVADAAAHVGIDLPGGTARSTEGCGGQSYKNHGDFVSHGGDPHSQCGKPRKSTTNQANQQPDKPLGGGAVHGCGKPPWAGKGNHANKTPSAVAARKAACGDDSGETDGPHAKRATPPTSVHASTPTTVPATTATTTAPSTTTTAPRNTTTSSTTTP